MALFFVSNEQISDNQIEITGGDVNHALRVLRLGVGSRIEVADFGRLHYDCTIIAADKERIVCRIDSRCEHDTEPTINVRLYQGLPKADKMETIIQKCTELGIASIVPVRSSRSIVQLNEKKAAERVTRWQKIAAEAAKQCRRSVIPVVEPLCSFGELFSKYEPAELALIPWEKEQQTGLKQVLEQKLPALLAGGGAKAIADTAAASAANAVADAAANGAANSALAHGNHKSAAAEIAVADVAAARPKPTVSILIGPEGGFEEAEVAQAIELGVIPVTLGPRILRTETAGMAVLAAIIYQSGNLG